MEHPEAGRRPACILTRQGAIAVLNAVLIAPATTHVRGLATEVALGAEDGMPTSCALSLDNLATVPKSLLTQRITRLGPAKIAALCDALAVATEC